MLKFLLIPPSTLWSTVHRVRRALYHSDFFKQFKASVPVISIGNLSMGGTGKTPMVLWCSHFFESHSIKPLIVTRGYKGKSEKGCYFLNAKNEQIPNPLEMGDEPYLIWKNLKLGSIVIGRERSKNIQKIFRLATPDVIILDDGFQHLSILRDLNILLIDISQPLDSFFTFPHGKLREDESALKDADVVIFTKVNLVENNIKQIWHQKISPFLKSDTLVAETFYKSEGILDTKGAKMMDLSECQGRKCMALSAIAHPTSFFMALQELGFEIVEKITYDDHHQFSLEEVNQLLLKATQNSLPIIMSEKDMVKVAHYSQDARFGQLRIKVDFLSGKKMLEERLTSLHQTPRQ